jgi:hypothetical protein
VLHALEFLSQKKQDQHENGSAHGNENDASTISNEEDDVFMGLDDVPVEARISLDNNVDRDDLQRKNVRPPANLLVFEGDCLDSEASELDSYLLFVHYSWQHVIFTEISFCWIHVMRQLFLNFCKENVLVKKIIWLIKAAQCLLKTDPVCSLPQMEDQGAQVVNRPLEKSKKI